MESLGGELGVVFYFSSDYFRKLIFAIASRPKYLFILFFISSDIYDNCNVNAGFVGRSVILNRPSRIFFIAAMFAMFAISGPIISVQRATKSESDARTPNIRNSPPIAPAIVWGRAVRVNIFLFCWFDI